MDEWFGWPLRGHPNQPPQSTSTQTPVKGLTKLYFHVYLQARSARSSCGQSPFNQPFFGADHMSVFKIVFAALSLIAFGTSASAAWPCIPAEGPYMNPVSGYVENRPRFIDPSRNCYVPQGTSSAGNQQTTAVPQQQVWQQQQQQYQQQGQILAPQMYPPQQGWGQQYQHQPHHRRHHHQPQYAGNGGPVVVLPGQTPPAGYCSTNIISGALIGALAGAVIGDNRRSAGAGAVLGMLFAPCNTVQQQQPLYQQQQQLWGQQPAQGVQNPCAGQVGRIPVYRANGNVGCRLANAQPEPGERPYP